MAEWLAPILEASDLEIVTEGGSPGGSDHLSFYRREVPILFSIIADFHDDYHTPKDESWLINREGGVMTVELYHEILTAASRRPEPFVFKAAAQAQQGGGARGGFGNIKVRFGIGPSYEQGEDGIVVDSVSQGGAAEGAGVLAGDRIIRWNDETITDIRSSMTMLSEHEPGDRVKLVVEREGEEKTLFAVMQARGGR